MYSKRLMNETEIDRTTETEGNKVEDTRSKL